jgi:hypothetical protein
MPWPTKFQQGLIGKAASYGMFRSLQFDFLLDEEAPVYEMPNPAGILCLSWASRLDSTIRWKPVKLSRGDGYFRPPLTTLKRPSDQQLQDFIDNHPRSELALNIGALALQSESSKETFRTVYQRRQSGERIVRALTELPQRQKYHIVIPHRGGQNSPLSFGITVSPRKPDRITPNPTFPHFWGTPLKEWMQKHLNKPTTPVDPPLAPPTAWERLLRGDLF